MKTLLLLLVSTLPVFALPQREVLSIFGADSDALLSTRAVQHTLKPTTRFSVSQSLKPTLATSQSSQVQSTLTSTQPTNSAESTAIQTTLVSTSVLPASAERHDTDHSNKTWQIIGITIITVLFIATSITCAMFFDRVWRFLKDVVRCTSRPVFSEEFIPDREKHSWDTRTLSPPRDNKVAIRPRELPWDTDTKDWNTLHRHPSRRNDHPPPV